MPEQELTRRDRYRRQTVAEIKELAMTQVREVGPDALSLAAIARGMAMSASALYRYFASRDELLAELTVDVYLALAGTLEAAADQGESPVARVRSVANAYRDWALAKPHAYHLACELPPGSGLDHAASRIVSASLRSMNVLLSVVAEVGDPPDVVIPTELRAQLRGWNGGDLRGLSPRVLHFGTRLVEQAARTDQPGVGAAHGVHRGGPRTVLPERGRGNGGQPRHGVTARSMC